MAEMNLPPASAALIGLFSGDRKSAKNRELQAVQTMYNMEQQKIRQEYQNSLIMARQTQAADKIAAQITTRKKDVLGLQQTLNDTKKNIDSLIKTKYGGNVMKGMAAEGNELWASAVGNYEGQLARLSANEKEIAKFQKAALVTPHLVSQGDLQRLQNYNNETEDNFVFSGLLNEIDEKYPTSVPGNKTIQADDILKYGNNSVLILANYMKEYGVKDETQVTQQQLLDYTQQKYMTSQVDMYGTAEDKKSTVGGEIYKNQGYYQDLTIGEDLDIFNTQETDKLFANVKSTTSKYGYDENKKPGKQGGYRLNSTAAIYTQMEPEVLEAVYGSKERSVARTTNGMYDNKGVQIQQDENELEDLMFNGFYNAIKYTVKDKFTGQEKSSLAVTSEDPKENKLLFDEYKESGANPSIVMVAGFTDDKFFGKDLVYDEVEVSRTLASKISDKAGYEIDNPEFEDIEKTKRRAEEISNRKQTHVTNLINNQFEGGAIQDVDNFQNQMYTNIKPYFHNSGINEGKMFVPFMSFMMANTTGDNALAREMRRMFSILPDKQNQFTKALLTNNPSDFINFAEKRLPSQTEINEFHQLIQDWNGYYTNTQNR